MARQEAKGWFRQLASLLTIPPWELTRDPGELQQLVPREAPSVQTFPFQDSTSPQHSTLSTSIGTFAEQIIYKPQPYAHDSCLSHSIKGINSIPNSPKILTPIITQKSRFRYVSMFVGVIRLLFSCHYVIVWLFCQNGWLHRLQKFVGFLVFLFFLTFIIQKYFYLFSFW